MDQMLYAGGTAHPRGICPSFAQALGDSPHSVQRALYAIARHCTEQGLSSAAMAMFVSLTADQLARSIHDFRFSSVAVSVTLAVAVSVTLRRGPRLQQYAGS